MTVELHEKKKKTLQYLLHQPPMFFFSPSEAEVDAGKPRRDFAAEI